MPTVTTTYGKLEGLQRERHQAFLGIPFAAPPVGERRFKAPEPPAPWSGIRNAKQFGNSARQLGHPLGASSTAAPWAAGFAARGSQDEDCLYLNIYTPAADSAGRPVLFWIHGGGYTHGTPAEPIYDGGPLSTRGDVVVVTINYRLGALGFLDLDELLPRQGLSANCGQLDMIAALEWTRDNIGALGGDPHNVTVFGESAGAWAASTLLAMPGAKGLFQKAILQSGTGAANDRGRSTRIAEGLLEELGIRAEPGQIRTISADKILAAQAAVAIKLGRGTPVVFGPVVDGVSLLKQPIDAIRGGEASAIPVLLGTNRDEWKIVGAATAREEIDGARLTKALAGALPNVSPEAIQSLIDTYIESRATKGLPHRNLDIMDAVLSDQWMRVGAVRLAAAQHEHQPNTFLYLFTYGSPVSDGRLGSCHALEMTFVFGTTDAPDQEGFVGSGPDVGRLSANMMGAWLSFARSGNPAHEGIGDWPAYSSASRPTMIFDRESRIETDPLGEERQAIERLIP